MKNVFVLILLTTVSSATFSQWELSLTLRSDEGIADMSAPTDNIVWIVTNDLIFYKTSDGGANWNRIKPKGFAANVFALQVYGVSGSTAFLSVNTGFTGVGPGIIYKTTDGGHNWLPVFSHQGNCEIKLAMFDRNNGLMGCSFDSFDGSIRSGSALYYTNDGGEMWRKDTLQAPVFIDNLVVKSKQVGIANYKSFNYSQKYGLSWARLKLPLDATSTLTEFEDSSYVLTLVGNGTQVAVKRPGSNEWVQSNGLNSFNLINCLVLDGNECWLGAALDTKNNFYSSDSAKNFTPFTGDPNSGFQFLTKARTGRTLIGGTPSFMQGKIWLNKRSVPVAQRSSPVFQKNILNALE